MRHAQDKSLILNSRPEVIRESVEGSLRRLGTDRIDLYYQHRIDPKVSAEEVAGTMARLIDEGKIRHWGISETDEAYLRRAHAVCPVTAVENRYSMMARWHESLFPALEELNIGFVAFSPMANGFLSGRYDANSKFEAGTDYRSFMPQYTPEGMERGQELLRLLERLGAEKGATPAQLSLAWMLCKKPWIVPIPGSRKIERLKENIGAAGISLSSQVIRDIDAMLDTMDLLVFGGSKRANSGGGGSLSPHYIPGGFSMFNFDYYNPTHIVFGKDRIGKLAKLIPEKSRVLMTYGGGSAKRSGLIAKIQASLGSIPSFEFGGIEPNPRYETLIKALDIIKKERIDFLLAIGGGSVIDGTKFIALAAKCKGDPQDLLKFGLAPIPSEVSSEALPIGVVLTLPATGSEMNSGAVISLGHAKLPVMSGLVFP